MKRVPKHCWKRCGLSISIENGYVLEHVYRQLQACREHMLVHWCHRGASRRAEGGASWRLRQLWRKDLWLNRSLDVDQLMAHRQLIRRSFRQTSTTLAERFVAHSLDVAVQ